MSEERYRIAPKNAGPAIKLVLENILESAGNFELEPRVRIQEVPDLRARSLRDHADEEHTIFRFPLAYLDSRVRLMIFRREGTKYDSPSYGLIDDIAGFYQAVGIDELVTMIKPNVRNVMQSIQQVVPTMRLTRTREQD